MNYFSFVKPLNNHHSVFKNLNVLEIEDFQLEKPFDAEKLDFNLFIDRATFLTAMESETCRKLLVLLLVCAKSVCFSSLMPRDKGNVVKLLKENVKFKPLVVSIGNGEGDITMLQNSDVGISLNTFNSSILKNFSDLSISSFSNLEPLILKFGHLNNSRLSRAIYLFVYKNFFLTLLLLAFTFQCAYSGTSLFTASLLVGYNIFFTTFPVLVIGVCDEDISEKQLFTNPEVYVEGVNGNLFN